MNESKTLWGNYAESFSLGISWTPFQTANLLMLVMLFYFYSGAAKRGTTEGSVVVLSSAYLVLNQICWVAFSKATWWDSGEQIFDYSFQYLLPACSFYLGIIVLVALVCTTVSIVIKRKEYKRRHLVSALLACTILMIGVTISARTPIAFQSWLDGIEPREERLGNKALDITAPVW